LTSSTATGLTPAIRAKGPGDFVESSDTPKKPSVCRDEKVVHKQVNLA
jgi:hypothetical protein